MKKLIYALTLILFSCYSLSAKEIFVDINYSQLDANGSLEKPFNQINKALKFASKNDVIILKKGIYRENITINIDNIKIKNYKDDYVLISGCELFSLKDCLKTNLNGKDVYQIPTKNKVFDVFVDGELFHLARYPNKTESMQSNKDWLWAMLKEEAPDSLRFTQLPKDDSVKIFTDGYYLGLHDKNYAKNQKFAAWFALIAPIKETDSTGLITLDGKNASSGYSFPNTKFGEGIGLGYVIGAEQAFDSPKEWYSKADNTYFILDDSQNNQDLKVEARTSLIALKVNAKNISFKGLNFKATALAVYGDNFSMDYCSMRNMTPFIASSDPKGNTSSQSLLCQWGDISNASIALYIEANGAKITNSYFAHSYFSAIRIRGNDALVDNCIVDDINWIACRAGAIHPWGSNIILSRNTIRNVGGSGLEGGNAAPQWGGIYSTNNIWEYNLIENTTNLIVDQGAFYINHQSGSNPYGNNIVRYNIIKNIKEPEKGLWTNGVAALYIDNNSSGYLVHNNIVVDARKGIKYNDFPSSPERVGKDVYYFNNTFINVDTLVNYGLRVGNWVERGASSKAISPSAKNLIIQNNIAINSSSSFSTEKTETTPLWTNNYCIDSSLVKDVDGFDFSLQGESLKLRASQLNYEYILKFYPEIINTNYVGAVNPQKGMWQAGSSLEERDYAQEDLKLLKSN